MKKRLFITLLMALVMPFAMKAQTHFVNLDTAACESFTWNVNGQTYTTSCEDMVRSNDTIYVLSLTINHPAPAYDSVVSGVCSHMFNDTVRYTSGSYHAFYPAGNGQCDREINLHLTISTQAARTQEAFSCGEYTWDRLPDSILTTTGTYGPVTLRDSITVDGEVYHCDSVLSLDLTIMVPEQIDVYDTITGCDKASYKFHAQSTINFTRSETVTSDQIYGTRSSYLPSTLGEPLRKRIYNSFHPRGETQDYCYDKVITLTINIKNSTKEYESIKACDSYDYYGSYETIDSIRHISNHDSVWVEADSVWTFVSDTTYTVDTTLHEYGDHFTRSVMNKAYCRGLNAVGCGDTIVLNLTINPSPAVYVEGDINLRPGNDGTTLYGRGDQSGLQYKWIGPGAPSGYSDTINTGALTSNTDYTIIGVNPATTCTDTNFFTVTVTVGVDEAEKSGLRLYPNPATDHVMVECGEPVRNITLYNTIGQRVLVSESTLLKVNNLASGTYAVRIETESGRVIVRSLVVTR